jgi:hypothetical protein
MGLFSGRKKSDNSSGSNADCSHPGTWDSEGPVKDDNGRSCNKFYCPRCRRLMRTTYPYD